MLIKIDSAGAGKRLDAFLPIILKESFGVEITRSIGTKLSETILVNGEGVKRSYKLKAGDLLSISKEDVTSLVNKYEEERNIVSKVVPESGDLKIIDENEDWIVLYKPKGIVVHPGVGNYSNTLANYVAGYLSSKGEYDENVKRGGVVHRLDKGVSGLIVFAKNLTAQKFLSAQFQKREVRKLYVADVVEIKRPSSTVPKDDRPVRDQINEFLEKGVDGTWLKVEGMIARDSVNRKRMRFSQASKSGKKALTYLKVIGNGRFLISIHTGRMHQIRATLRYLGFVIINDSLYGYKGSVSGEGIGLESVFLGFGDKSKRKASYIL